MYWEHHSADLCIAMLSNPPTQISLTSGVNLLNMKLSTEHIFICPSDGRVSAIIDRQEISTLFHCQGKAFERAVFGAVCTEVMFKA
jgi:hypothetical protein